MHYVHFCFDDDDDDDTECALARSEQWSPRAEEPDMAWQHLMNDPPAGSRRSGSIPATPAEVGASTEGSMCQFGGVSPLRPFLASMISQQILDR